MKALVNGTMLTLFLTNICFAQWIQTSGPYGANVYSLLYGDNIVAAGTENGIYLATPGNMIWQTDNGKLPGHWIFELADLEDRYYAATIHGVYISSDNGMTWNASGLSDHIVTKFTVKDSLLFAGTTNGLFISSDKGLSWNEIDSGFTSKNVYAIATNSNLVLVSTLYDGLYKSTNNGESWIKLNSNSYFALLITGNITLAASWDNAVYRSTDFGNTWMSYQIGENWVRVTNLIEDGQNTFAATSYGAFLSTDMGITWQPRGLSGIYIHNLIIDNSSILAGTAQGVYSSADYGLNWMLKNDGLLSAEVTSLTSLNSRLFAGTYGFGVFLTTDEGESWQSFNNGLANMFVSGVGLTEDYLFAGTDGGVYRTSSFTDQWQKVSNKTGTKKFVFSGDEIIASSNEGVLRSIDNGNTWALIDSGTGHLCWSVLKMDQRIIAGYNQSGIRISTDNGLTWDYSNTGLPGYSTIDALELSDNRILAGTTGSGIYLSDDYGQTWYQSELDSTQIWSLYKYGAYIFGCGGRGICQSNDNGLNWHWINEGLIDYFVKGLTVDGGYLFSGVANASVWQRSLSELTGNAEINQAPAKFALEQNYPNPFNPATTIKYQLPQGGFVTLKVYDVLGNEVASLVNGEENSGSYSINFDASKLASGVYIYELRVNEYLSSRKMLLLK